MFAGSKPMYEASFQGLDAACFLPLGHIAKSFSFLHQFAFNETHEPCIMIACSEFEVS
jgi:hypothetical protein